MTRLRNLSWPLVLGLGALGLIRPALNITGVAGQLGRPLTPILLTVGISAVWIVAAVRPRVLEPLLTLVCAGVAYAVFTILGSGILSPILDGELRGPLANPPAIIGVFAVNLAWGLVTGLVATEVQRRRGNAIT